MITFPRVGRYTIAPGSTAVIHITNIIDDVLVVGDVWNIPGQSVDDSQFRAEVAAAEVALSPADSDGDAPPAKRQRLSFDAA